MPVDQATVRRIAHLARIRVPDEEVAGLGDEQVGQAAGDVVAVGWSSAV